MDTYGHKSEGNTRHGGTGLTTMVRVRIRVCFRVTCMKLCKKFIVQIIHYFMNCIVFRCCYYYDYYIKIKIYSTSLNGLLLLHIYLGSWGADTCGRSVSTDACGRSGSADAWGRSGIADSRGCSGSTDARGCSGGHCRGVGSGGTDTWGALWRRRHLGAFGKCGAGRNQRRRKKDWMEPAETREGTCEDQALA